MMISQVGITKVCVLCVLGNRGFDTGISVFQTGSGIE